LARPACAGKPFGLSSSPSPWLGATRSRRWTGNERSERAFPVESRWCY